jgi:RNA polymerase sigma-70 factor (ECF subfamily)
MLLHTMSNGIYEREALMTNPSAALVIHRLAEGNQDALGELYDRYAGLVNGVALRIVRDAADAEDVVQAVFLQAWRQADRYDAGRGSAEAWLTTLARTRALDCLRRRASRRETPRTVATGSTGMPATVTQVAIHEALGVLPHNQRQTLELAYYEGLTQAEIAQRLGQPLGTIKTRTRMALRHLRRTLGSSAVSSARQAQALPS